MGDPADGAPERKQGECRTCWQLHGTLERQQAKIDVRFAAGQ